MIVIAGIGYLNITHGANSPVFSRTISNAETARTPPEMIISLDDIRYRSNHITIEWVGTIAVANLKDPYAPTLGWLRGFELGLRSDGVMVWRETK